MVGSGLRGKGKAAGTGNAATRACNHDACCRQNQQATDLRWDHIWGEMGRRVRNDAWVPPSIHPMDEHPSLVALRRQTVLKPVSPPGITLRREGGRLVEGKDHQRSRGGGGR